MKAIVPLVGWLVLAASIVGCLTKFNTHWQVGRYGMPHTVVAEDGWHYSSGTEIDPLTLAVVQSGYEEEIGLGMAAFVVGCMSWVFWRHAHPRQPGRNREGGGRSNGKS